MSSEMSSVVKLQAIQVQTVPVSSRNTLSATPKSSEHNVPDSEGVATHTVNPSSVAGKSLPQSGEPLPPAQVTNQVDNTSANDSKNAHEDNTRNDVMAVVRNLQDIVQNSRRELNFSVDEDTDTVVIKVLDSESQEVIRQIPAEEVLDLARRAAQRSDNKGQLFRLEV